MSLSHWGALVLSCLDFLSFIWAVQAFFVIPGSGMPKPMRLLALPGILTMVATVILLWGSSIDDKRTLAGIILYLLSLALFWWTIGTNCRRPLQIAFSEADPQHLVSSGPYRFIRHPFYSSYILAWLAGPVVTGCYWLLIPAALFTYLYYRAARFEENLFSRSAQSRNYDSYRKRTGMFFPKLF